MSVKLKKVDPVFRKAKCKMYAVPKLQDTTLPKLQENFKELEFKRTRGL